MKNRGINRRFQSTLPLRGATSCDNGLCKSFLISIHAPHERSDVIYDNSILSVTKISYSAVSVWILFYDNSILSVTKMLQSFYLSSISFYDNSILSVTKIGWLRHCDSYRFYDNSILSVTKITLLPDSRWYCFTITQFFQLLK